MKATWIFGILLAAEMTARVGNRSGPSLMVLLTNEAVPLADIQTATSRTTWIFADIGVRLEWRANLPSQGGKTAPGVVVKLNISESTECRSDALGCAFPYAGSSRSISVSYARIKETYPPGMQVTVLAHVMAHEIAHVLQGVYRHSDSGIMKAHWIGKDAKLMQVRSLRFAEFDADLILSGLKQAR